MKSTKEVLNDIKKILSTGVGKQLGPDPTVGN